MIKMIAFCVVAFCMFSVTVVQAGDTSKTLQERFSAEQMRATGLDTLSAEQLALLNQLLQEQLTQAAVVVEQKAEVVSTPAPVASVAPVAPMAVPVLSSEPFKSKVLGNFATWQTGTVFTLENGQQWQVNKGNAKLPKALNDPNVYVGVSLVGKWYFQFDDEDLPRAMVTRIK